MKTRDLEHRDVEMRDVRMRDVQIEGVPAERGKKKAHKKGEVGDYLHIFYINSAVDGDLSFRF